MTYQKNVSAEEGKRCKVKTRETICTSREIFAESSARESRKMSMMGRWGNRTELHGWILSAKKKQIQSQLGGSAMFHIAQELILTAI
jgi:hypothetical protein